MKTLKSIFYSGQLILSALILAACVIACIASFVKANAFMGVISASASYAAAVLFVIPSAREYRKYRSTI